MAEEKVCLLTGAAGSIGQRLITELVAKGHKIIALADTADVFSPEILKSSRIRITTALPVSAELFKKNDVAFCFGDIGDISFLASIFFAAARGGVDIEYVIHLSSNALIEKASPASYAPKFGATANVIEVTRAYWQSNKESFKGFFFAADMNKKADVKTEEMLVGLAHREKFPAHVFRGPDTVSVAADYKGKTSLESLYRLVTPVATSVKWEEQPLNTKELYTASLVHAVRKMVEE